MRRKALRTAFVLAVSLVVATPGSVRGYFLSATQKKDLVLRGAMYDDEGRLYQVWIVPGYEGPLQDARQGWHDAGDSLADYGRAELYEDIRQASRDAWRVGTEDTLKEFALRGTRRAWQDGMSLARQRTERRVFGWWLAYPWGLFEATTESVFRLGGGIPTGLVIAASAYTVVPVLHFGAPVPKALWYSTVPGTGLPLAAAGWNTMIAPPLALLGQEPAPERADGFWLAMVSEAPPPAEGLEEAVESVSAWREGLLAAVPADAVDAAARQLDREREARIQALQAQMDAVVQEIDQRKSAARAEWFDALLSLAHQRQAELHAELAAKGLPAHPSAAERQALRAALVTENLRPEEVEMLLDVVAGPANGSEAGGSPVEEKTDPLKRSLEILEKP